MYTVFKFSWLSLGSLLLSENEYFPVLDVIDASLPKAVVLSSSSGHPTSSCISDRPSLPASIDLPHFPILCLSLILVVRGSSNL